MKSYSKEEVRQDTIDICKIEITRLKKIIAELRKDIEWIGDEVGCFYCEHDSDKLKAIVDKNKGCLRVDQL